MYLDGLRNEWDNVGTHVDACGGGSLVRITVVARGVRASAVSEGRGGGGRRLHGDFVSESEDDS